MNEKERIQEEIENLKSQMKYARKRIEEIERAEKLKPVGRCDIISRIKNKAMLDVVFPYYDQVTTDYRKMTGKVVLRHWTCTQHNFNTIRNLAKMITDYVVFQKRSDGYVEQSTVKRNIDKLDDTEIKLVAECTDELIAVLYKYKVLCNEHQNMDYSEFLLESEEENG